MVPRASSTSSSAKTASLLANGERAYLRESYARSYGLYRKAVKLDPKNPDARFGLALTAFQVGRTRQSRSQVLTTLELKPDHPEALILIGFLDQVTSRPSLAGEHYERYLELYPEGEWAEELRSVLTTLGTGV